MEIIIKGDMHVIYLNFTNNRATHDDIIIIKKNDIA